MPYKPVKTSGWFDFGLGGAKEDPRSGEAITFLHERVKHVYDVNSFCQTRIMREKDICRLYYLNEVERL